MVQVTEPVSQPEEEEPLLTFEELEEQVKTVLKTLWSTQKEVAGKVQEQLVATMARMMLGDPSNRRAKYGKLEGVFYLKNLQYAPMTKQFVAEFTWAPKIVSIMDTTVLMEFPLAEFE